MAMIWHVDNILGHKNYKVSCLAVDCFYMSVTCTLRYTCNSDQLTWCKGTFQSTVEVHCTAIRDETLSECSYMNVSDVASLDKSIWSRSPNYYLHFSVEKVLTLSGF